MPLNINSVGESYSSSTAAAPCSSHRKREVRAAANLGPRRRWRGPGLATLPSVHTAGRQCLARSYVRVVHDRGARFSDRAKHPLRVEMQGCSEHHVLGKTEEHLPAPTHWLVKLLRKRIACDSRRSSRSIYGTSCSCVLSLSLAPSPSAVLFLSPTLFSTAELHQASMAPNSRKTRKQFSKRRHTWELGGATAGVPSQTQPFSQSTEICPAPANTKPAKCSGSQRLTPQQAKVCVQTHAQADLLKIHNC